MTLGVFWKHHFLSKIYSGYFFGNFLKTWATFLVRDLVTLAAADDDDSRIHINIEKSFLR